MPTYTIPVLTEADLLAAGGSVGSNGSFATAGSTFTYSEAAMPWYTMVIEDNGADTTTLSGDTDAANSDGGVNADNEGSDGETGTLVDPDGNPVGSSGRIAADRSGVLEGSDGSTILIYEIENNDDIDIYAFSAPLVDGVTYTNTAQNTRDEPIQYSQMVCLAEGTSILTPSGYKSIECLKIGDCVMTADHGAQIIRWVTSSAHRFEERGYDPRPVKIRAGTSGNSHDLIVSPQHRVVVDLARNGKKEACFVAAKHLAEEFNGRVRYANGIRTITFFNMFLDRHEVIFAEGTQVESLYPGLETRKAPGVSLAGPLRVLFPDLWAASTKPEIEAIYGPVARRVIGRGELRSSIAAGQVDFPRIAVGHSGLEMAVLVKR